MSRKTKDEIYHQVPRSIAPAAPQPVPMHDAVIKRIIRNSVRLAFQATPLAIAPIMQDFHEPSPEAARALVVAAGNAIFASDDMFGLFRDRFFCRAAKLITNVIDNTINARAS